MDDACINTAFEKYCIKGISIRSALDSKDTAYGDITIAGDKDSRAAKVTGSENISGFDCIPAISGTNISTIKYSYSEMADATVLMLKERAVNSKKIVAYEYVMNA